jgi:methylthioribose-1-phosphate isomerase
MRLPTLEWRDDALILLDQTLLPEQVEFLVCRDVETVARAIEELRVRGAPAIGVAAAFGVVLAAQATGAASAAAVRGAVLAAIGRLAQTRPTAVNLFWALARMETRLHASTGAAGPATTAGLLDEARSICEEDRQICRRLGVHGAALLGSDVCVITHCNAGALATVDYGTALGVIYAAQEQGKRVRVFSDETRPLLQGSRLTAWELSQAGIDVTVICDSMAAVVMRQERPDCVIVGADRIAGNGDVANKIGTYGLAVLAREHRVPFYVAAPVSTLDASLASGELIPIEERRPEEVTAAWGRRTAPAGVRVFNPAFDVTPARFVSAIISEQGIARPPFGPVLRAWAAASRAS